MGFNTFRIVATIVALMGLSALAALYTSSPRIVVTCGLVAVLCVDILRRSFVQLVRRQPTDEIPIRSPLDRQNLPDNFAKLEARLEYAPIALFLIAPENNQATPLNNFARRMLAPGRISDLVDFNTTLIKIEDQQRNIIIFNTERGQERAIVAVNHFHIGSSDERLIAVLPIESELETVAFKAWQQLAHVLTHEIMNSLTPVASLSRTAHDLLAELQSKLSEQTKAAKEYVQDLSTALDAISRRADSLVVFVSNYRSLTNVPAPLPECIRLEQLFSRIAALLTPVWLARKGSATFTVEPASLDIMIDPGQLEQAIINLIKNAEEATTKVTNPSISVHARLTRGSRLRIEISDNGPGVPNDLIPHIFTPFFTTKAKGNGIGLAMVRQLVHSNGGTVRYVKMTNAGAKFVLTF